MEVYKSLNSISSAKLGKVCATIGNFDGVHLGHQQILKQLREHAQQHGFETLLIVFEPLPLEFFNVQVPRLYSEEQKVRALAHTGLVDHLLVLDFNAELANTDPHQFLNDLLAAVQLHAIFMGNDFRFGKGRAGNIETLKEFALKHNFSVVELDTVLIDPFKQAQLSPASHELISSNEGRVSSSFIRKLLADDHFELANELMCEPFHFRGVVEHGRKLARNLKCPTANIDIGRKHSPIQGTYFCEVVVEALPTDNAQTTIPTDVRLPAICNVGYKPTVNSDVTKWVCEAHILNFNYDLYNRTIRVYPVRKHRDEMKFNNFDALAAQILADVESTYRFFKVIKFPTSYGK